MVLAEENWIRGYQQAMFDIDDAEKEIAKLEHQNELTNDTES
jgi:hypothetical protein